MGATTLAIIGAALLGKDTADKQQKAAGDLRNQQVIEQDKQQKELEDIEAEKNRQKQLIAEREKAKQGIGKRGREGTLVGVLGAPEAPAANVAIKTLLGS